MGETARTVKPVHPVLKAQQVTQVQLAPSASPASQVLTVKTEPKDQPVLEVPPTLSVSSSPDIPSPPPFQHAPREPPKCGAVTLFSTPPVTCSTSRRTSALPALAFDDSAPCHTLTALIATCADTPVEMASLTG